MHKTDGNLLNSGVISFFIIVSFYVCVCLLSNHTDFATLAPHGLLNVTKLVVNRMSTDKSEFFAKNLIKLERLTIFQSSFDQILPFICHSKSSKTISIGKVISNEYFDLFALNEEREKLESSAQVTINLPENHYLTEIWKIKNLNLNHVKIARNLEQ